MNTTNSASAGTKKHHQVMAAATPVDKAPVATEQKKSKEKRLNHRITIFRDRKDGGFYLRTNNGKASPVTIAPGGQNHSGNQFWYQDTFDMPANVQGGILTKIGRDTMVFVYQLSTGTIKHIYKVLCEDDTESFKIGHKLINAHKTVQQDQYQQMYSYTFFDTHPVMTVFAYDLIPDEPIIPEHLLAKSEEAKPTQGKQQQKKKPEAEKPQVEASAESVETAEVPAEVPAADLPQEEATA